MEMNRYADLALERREQAPRSLGLDEAGHVLDAEDVGARRFEFFGERYVVIEIVFRPVRIEDVARVAHRRFAQPTALDYRFDRDAHVVDPVERVEHAEDVDAG